MKKDMVLPRLKQYEEGEPSFQLKFESKKMSAMPKICHDSVKAGYVVKADVASKINNIIFPSGWQGI